MLKKIVPDLGACLRRPERLVSPPAALPHDFAAATLPHRPPEW